MDDQPGRLYVPPTPVRPEQHEEARRNSADPLINRSGRVPAAERDLPPSSLDPDIIEDHPSTRSIPPGRRDRHRRRVRARAALLGGSLCCC